MTANSLRLPAKIYSCLSENQGRPLAFEELCVLLYPSNNVVHFFSTEIEYKTQVMMSLIFLSDLNLITLNELTDESFLNLSNRN
ncbi:hypothetical protein [Flavobacterium hydrophilum]|uniref:hypothetical protein n=1 Tax=Flavobacterium hydrophilum TaxID=2211445 RepID=UPI000F4DC2E5|nr:hypothetical protein [Flavobacterium hydrophilum]